MSLRARVATITAVLLLAACGSDTSPVDSSTATSTVADATTITSTQMTATIPTAPSASSTGTTAPDSTAGPTTTAPAAVVDATGASFDPLPDGAPVVDLGFVSLDLAALGLSPAAVGYPPSVLDSILSDIDPEIGARVQNSTAAISDGFEVQIEAIAALDPALILTTSFYATQFADALDQLSSVAPVFVVDGRAAWNERLEVLGALFGRAVQAGAVIDDTANRIAQLAVDVTSSGKQGSSVSILRLGVSEAGGDFEAYVSPGLPSEVVTTIGLQQPTAQQQAAVDPSAQFPRIGVSYENVAQHDAEVLVVLEIPGLLIADAALATPTFAALDAVGAGRVIRGNYLLWTSGGDVGVTAILGDLTAALDLLD